MYWGITRIIFQLSRTTYLTDKRLAETGRRIEEGQHVQPRMTLDVDHGIWLCSVGGGFGKMQWRLVRLEVLQRLYEF